MSHAKILELLQTLDFPGSDKLSELDIEQMAEQHEVVAQFFEKVAKMDSRLFLNKEQTKILQLAGEMNDPAFLPTDPKEVRTRLAFITERKHHNKILQMRLRHRREEKCALEEAISVLKQDKVIRDKLRAKREQDIADGKLLRQKAEEVLVDAQQSAQKALTTLVRKGRSRWQDMTKTAEVLRKSNGLCNVLDSEKYILFANGIVDMAKALHDIVNRPKLNPERCAVSVANGHRVYLVKTLRETSENLVVQCNEIMSIIRSLGGSTATLRHLEDALTSYREDIQDAIQMFINELSQTAAANRKKQLDEIVPVMTDLETVIWIHRCLLTEEISLLKACLGMVQSAQYWASSFALSVAKGDANETANNETASKTATLTSGSQLSSGNASDIQSHALLSFSALGSAQAQQSSYSTLRLSIESLDMAVDKITYTDDPLHKACEQLHNDQKLLAAIGTDVFPRTALLQLRTLEDTVSECKARLRRLLDQRERLEKDLKSTNYAHRQRTLVPLFILDRDCYEETKRSMI